MTYCLETDVEGLTGLVVDADSQPNTTEVAQIMASVSAEIDGVLKATGYSVPITSGANDLALLKSYATLGSSYRTWHATEFITESFDKVKSWEQDYRDFLSRMRRGEQSLIDNFPPVTPQITGTFGYVAPTRSDGYSD